MEHDAPDGIVVHVIPLLFEGDFWRSCDKTVLVVAPRDVRIARVIGRDSTERAAVEQRIAAQIDPAIARARADYVIENEGDLLDLDQRSARVYDQLLRDLAAKERPG